MTRLFDLLERHWGWFRRWRYQKQIKRTLDEMRRDGW